MPAVFAQDNFDRADVSPLASPWATVTSATGNQLVSNKVRVVAVDAVVPAMSRYGAFNVSAMRCTATILAHSAAGQVGVGVRVSSTAQTGYFAVAANGTIDIQKFVAAAFSALTFAVVSFAPGDTIGIEITGSAITGYKNGVSVVTTTDTDIESGTWGVRLYEPTNLGDNELDTVVMETFEPVYMGVGAEGSAASGDITLGEPTYATGFAKLPYDIWIAAVHSSDQVTHTFAGWTEIVQGNGGGTTSRLSVWYHRYLNANPAFLVGHASGQTPIGGIAAFRCCFPTGSPVDQFSAIAGGTDASMEHTAVTPSVDHTKLLAINGAADDNDRTLLSGYTNVFLDGATLAFISTAGNPDGSVSMIYKRVNVVVSVSSGTQTVTQAASDAWASTLVALKAMTSPFNWSKPLVVLQARKRAGYF